MEGKGYIEANFRTNSPYAWSAPTEVIITGSTTEEKTYSNLLSLVGKPKPVFDKVYFKALLSRISGTSYNPYVSVGTLFYNSHNRNRHIQKSQPLIMYYLMELLKQSPSQIAIGV